MAIQQSHSTTSSASVSASTTTVRSRSSAKKSAEDMSSSASSPTGNNAGKDQRGATQSSPNGIFSIKPVDNTQETNESISSTSSESSDLGPICEWADLPHWMQDNPAIWTGYRRPTFSYRKCIASLGFLHNETGMDSLSRIGLLGRVAIDKLLICILPANYTSQHLFTSAGSSRLYHWITYCLLQSLWCTGHYPMDRHCRFLHLHGRCHHLSFLLRQLSLLLLPL